MDIIEQVRRKIYDATTTGITVKNIYIGHRAFDIAKNEYAFYDNQDPTSDKNTMFGLPVILTEDYDHIGIGI